MIIIRVNNVAGIISPGHNVIVKFNTDEEKEKIINYCDKNELEYTLCPRYIRVEENAVSIEVKRK